MLNAEGLWGSIFGSRGGKKAQNKVCLQKSTVFFLFVCLSGIWETAETLSTP